MSDLVEKSPALHPGGIVVHRTINFNPGREALGYNLRASSVQAKASKSK